MSTIAVFNKGYAIMGNYVSLPLHKDNWRTIIFTVFVGILLSNSTIPISFIVSSYFTLATMILQCSTYTFAGFTQRARICVNIFPEFCLHQCAAKPQYLFDYPNFISNNCNDLASLTYPNQFFVLFFRKLSFFISILHDSMSLNNAVRFTNYLLSYFY